MKKKVVIGIVAGVVVLGVVGIVVLGGLLYWMHTSSPTYVCEQFVLNAANGRIAEAKKYASEGTGRLLELGSPFLPILPDAKFISVSEKIDGDRAIVTFKLAADADPIQLPLVKIDGRWKIHVTPIL